MRVDRREWNAKSCGLIAGAVLLAAAFASVAPPSSSAPDRDRLILGPLRPSAIQPTTVWIEISSGRIERVFEFGGPSPSTTHFAKGLGADLFATPGLVDSHIHLPPTLALGQVDLFLLMFLMHGVTTVRELGSRGVDLAALDQSVESGRRPGPRIFSCGLPLTGAHEELRFLQIVTNGASLDDALAERSNDGLNCAKLYRGFPASLLPRARESARRLGLSLVGHLPRDSPWEAGEIDDIQHACDPRCSSLTPSAIKALARAAVWKGVRHTPTLVTYANALRNVGRTPLKESFDSMPRIWRDIFWNPNVLASMGMSGFRDDRGARIEDAAARDVVRSLIGAGAVIQVGTDTPFPFVLPGKSVHEEMRLLQGLDLSIDQVWAAATTTPGEFIGGGLLGQIVPGAPADILLFRDDPTRDLDALATLEYVIAGGRVYEYDDLRRRVDAQLEYLNGPVYQYGFEPLLRTAIQRFGRDPMNPKY